MAASPNGSLKVVRVLQNSERALCLDRVSHPYTEVQKGVLKLRFNAFDVQTEMRMEAPYDLVLRYTRTMAEVMKRRPGARQIGMVGLGGGSLAKYAYREFPRATIRIAEINTAVILMRKEFHVPDDDDRFRVSCEDGADFVCRFEDRFDLLVIDGYDRLGQPPQLCSLEFYRDCHRALAPNGLLVVNICDNHRLLSRIRRGFLGPVDLEDGDEKCVNTIVVAHKLPGSPARMQRTDTGV